MSFCVKDKLSITEGYTVVENSFILNYMSDAPEKTVLVYLLGKTMCEYSGNSIELIADKLAMTSQDVIDAYRYWEEMNLVSIIPTDPPQIVYYSVNVSTSMLKKIKPNKYSKFSKGIQSILVGRMLTPNEFNEYYMFLENTLFQPEALLAVAQYCVDLKGNNVSYQYILTVANNLHKQGIATQEKVAESLASTVKYDNDLRAVYKALSIKGKIEHDHRQLMHKWLVDMGFTLDTIIKVAKSVKGSNINKLAMLLDEYYSNGVMSFDEISAYKDNKDNLLSIAKTVARNIGVYYQNLDIVVEEYISRWHNLGYDGDTLEMLSKYCFRNNIRTLSGMSAIVEKLYKLGYTTVTAINGYIDTVANTDKLIKQVLDACGVERNITANDRRLFKIWTVDWAMSMQLILLASTKAIGTNNAMQYLSKILSVYKQEGIRTVEQAKLSDAVATTTTTTAKPAKKKHNYDQHTYTDGELNALFTDLDNIDI